MKRISIPNVKHSLSFVKNQKFCEVIRAKFNSILMLVIFKNDYKN